MIDRRMKSGGNHGTPLSCNTAGGRLRRRRGRLRIPESHCGIGTSHGQERSGAIPTDTPGVISRRSIVAADALDDLTICELALSTRCCSGSVRAKGNSIWNGHVDVALRVHERRGLCVCES